MLIQRAVHILLKDGFVDLVARLKNRIALHSENKLSATSATHKEAMKWFNRRKNGYERLISAVQPYVKSDTIIFDIGANIGYFTFLLAKRNCFKGSAYLFEPVTHLAELCKMTFQDVPYYVTVHDFGLSDKDAEEDIFIASNGNLGWNTLVSQKAAPDMAKLHVRLKRFDSCGLEVVPSFIKVDVEGAEYRVFRGMLGSLRKWHPLPVILCEIGWGQSHPAWEDELNVFAEMKAIGYTIIGLDGSQVDEESLKETTNVLFVPSKA